MFCFEFHHSIGIANFDCHLHHGIHKEDDDTNGIYWHQYAHATGSW